MPCSNILSMALQNEILSTEASDFLKQMIILKSFNSVLIVVVFMKFVDETDLVWTPKKNATTVVCQSV